MTTSYPSLFNWLPIAILYFTLVPELTARPSDHPDFALTIDCSRTNDPFFVGGVGDATITVSDGTPPYSVTWSGPVNGTGMLDADGDYRIDGLPAGEYAIIVQDLEGAVENCMLTLSERECDLEVEFVGVSPVCAGSASGAFVTLFNSNTSITWEWSDEANSTFRPFWVSSFGATGLKAGTYSATITDFFGCEVSDTITLTDPPALDVDCGKINHPSNPFTADGSVQPLLQGGTLPYRISWNGPESGDTTTTNPTNLLIDDLPSGDYELYVTDANGCTGYCSFVLGQSSDCNMNISLIPTHLSCNKNYSGSIDVTVTGGSGQYDFDWSDDLYDNIGDDGSINKISAGFYELTVTDTQGCRATASVLIREPEAFAISCGVQNYPTHSDSLDGNFAITLAEGAPTGPYTFYYTNEMGSGDTIMRPYDQLNDYIFTPKVTGPYDITVESAAGCRTSCQVDMTIPDCERNFLRARLQQGVSCAGESDGTLIVEIVNGNADNYTFSWNHPQYDGQDSLYNLPSGIYRVTATSPSGCIDIAGYGIVEPPPLLLSCTDTISPSVTGAADGRNLLTLIGGNPPYAISWDGPVNGTAQGIFPDKFEITGLSAGEYTVLLTDNKGCITSCAFFITDPKPPCDLALQCRANGPGEGQGEGSYSFIISGGTPLYHLELSGPITFGGFTLDQEGTWNSGILPEGDWTFMVTDANGCRQHCSFTVLPSPCIVDAVIIGTDVSCGEIMDGTAYVQILDSIGPVRYAWNTTADTPGIDNLFPGEYAVTITDNENCLIYRSITIGKVEVQRDTLEQTICAGDSLRIGSEVFDESRPFGEVILPGAASNGCDSIIAVSLNFLEPITAQLNQQLCSGDSLLIGADIFTEERPAGTVIFPGAAANGCDSILKVSLSFLEPVESLISETLCWEENLSIGNEIFDRDRPSGTVRLSTATGCDSIVRVDLSFLPEQTADLFGDTALCRSEDSLQLRLVVSGQLDYSFVIHNASGEVINSFGEGETLIPVLPIQSTTYVLKEVDSGNNCPIVINKDSVTITASDPQLTLLPATDYHGFPISCPGAQDGIIQAEVRRAISPISYQWSNGETTPGIQNLAADKYYLTISDQLGCLAEDSLTLTAPLPLLVSAQGQAPGCQGNSSGQIIINDIDGGTGVYSYQLQGNPFLPINGFPFAIGPVDNSGIYSLLVQDENGCQWSDTVRVPPGQILSLDLGPARQMEWGDSLQLVPKLNFTPRSWIWTISNGQIDTLVLAPIIRPLETTIYTLTATDENGCMVSSSVQVFVSTEVDLFIPNAFSPDGNGINDRLAIFAGPEVATIDRFEVYDRWGNQLFFQKDLLPNAKDIGWDGTSRGQPVNTGMYVYLAEITLINGQKNIISGEVYLIR